MDKAPISVVIPAYNSQRFIGEAIESVLAQTLSVSEIIVVDNNCTDNTQKIAEDLGAAVVHQKIQGVSAARNLGISASKNNWIAFLDADDIWKENKIEYQLKAIKKFPDARIVSCDFGIIFESEKRKVSPPPAKKPKFDERNLLTIDGVYSYCPAYTNELLEWILMTTPAAMFHREVFAHVGFFDESFTLAQDLEFFQRALARYPVATVKTPLIFIRKHNENRSSDQEALMEMHIRVTEKMLEFPEKYPPGGGEFFRERMKQTFLARGYRAMTEI